MSANEGVLHLRHRLIEVPRSGGYAKEHLDEHLGRFSICYVGNHFHILSMLVALNLSNVA